MIIAITLVHNKSDEENAAQIQDLQSQLVTVTDGPFTNPDTGESWTTFHQELIGFNEPHQVKVYQVIPYGVTPPPGYGEINSGGMVFYGAGDEDKVGDHPRFFNWGLKRGVDQGADLVIHLDDPTQLNAKHLSVALDAKTDSTVLDTTPAFGKVAYKELQDLHDARVSVLDESLDLATAVNDLAATVAETGMEVKNG